MPATDRFDVVVVGGGPAGSVTAWSLARRGVRVAVVERARFPREKVCGDFVEPGGLRILEAMGCLAALEGPARAPITANRVYFGPKLAYRGDIPYYEPVNGLPPHGYIISRSQLDAHLLEAARSASATVFEGVAATDIRREGDLVLVDLRDGTRDFTLGAPLVVGADGAESLVARSVGLRRTDRRYIGVSQRAYVEGVSGPDGEAATWFDDDIYPGYGWMFPMGGGRANVGVGMLSETCQRQNLSVPKAFAEAVARLRIRHPGCAKIQLASKPIGGVVKTYGGIDRNHFDGGLLVGDAGSFVDPMTGEGITQGMESALIASWTIIDALEAGRFDQTYLARFDEDFRDYFDPSMVYLDLCATLLRNWHFRDFWLRATRRGFEKVRTDPDFGRIAGTTFGGLNVQPLEMVRQVWTSVATHVAQGGAQAIGDLLTGRAPRSTAFLGDLSAWEKGWSQSLKDDPGWHVSWLADVMTKAARLVPMLRVASNPRTQGLLP